MMDYGYLLKYTRTINEFGEPVETWALGDGTICGIEYHEGRENPTVDMTTDSYEATLRIPHGLGIRTEDKFLLTQFRGEPASIPFEIVTPVWVGMTGDRMGVRHTTYEGNYESSQGSGASGVS